MDPVIKAFFEERKEGWLKKNIKASMTDVEVAEKQQECDRVFSREEWLPNAAKRAGQISISTHPCTFSHPSSRKNKNGYASSIIAKSKAELDGFVRSGNIEVAADALGNAAALDVYKFLMLKMQDGDNLLEHIEANSDVAQSLLNIKAATYDELRNGFLAMTQSESEFVTSSKIKQVFFPVGDDYHQLSILTPSGIVFDLRKRLDLLRFGKEVEGVNSLKVVREKKRKNEYDSEGYREIYGLTTIGYGGTKPQNISVLNNQNGGKAHLFLSAPPQLDKRDIQLPNRDFFTQSVSYYNSKVQFNKLHDLYAKDENNRHIRSARDEYYQNIIDMIIVKMWQVRSISSQQFNPEYNQLNSVQRIWLLDDYQYQRENEDEWLDKIITLITQFIFQGYEKVLAKKAVKLGDSEYQKMMDVVTKSKDALR